MRAIYLLLVLILGGLIGPTGLQAQQTPTDSLKYLLQQADTPQDSIPHMRAIVRLYLQKGSYKEAVEVGLKCLHLAKQYNDLDATASAANNLGIAFNSIGELAKAIEYLNIAISAEKRTENTLSLSYSLNNLGNVYHRMEVFDTALYYYEHSLALKKELKDPKGIAIGHNNVGLIHYEKGEYTRALSFFDMALQDLEKLKDNYDISNTANNIGKTYLKIGAFRQAQVFLQDALERSRMLGAKALEMENYEIQAELYATKEEYAKAYEFERKHEHLKDSMLNAERMLAISQWEARFNDQRKDLEIQLLNKESQLKDSQLKTRSMLNKALIAGFFIVLFFSLSLYRNILGKKQASEALQWEKDQIRNYLDTAEIIFVKLDTEYRIVTTNCRGAEILGYQIEELAGTLWAELFPDGIQGYVQKKLIEFRADQELKSFNIELPIYDKSGKELHFISWTFSIQKGEVDEILLSGNDVTEIRNAERKALQAMINGQEQERSRVAENLQKDIHPLLFALQQQLKSKPLEKNNELLDQILGNVSSLAYDLSPNRVKNYGLIACILESCNVLSQQYGVNIQFHPYFITGVFEEEIELFLYRIFQELVKNSLDHSQADRVEIQLLEKPESVTLKVEDNGTGFQLETEDEQGLGLKNMIARVKILNGKYHILSQEENGTTISVEVPKRNHSLPISITDTLSIEESAS